MAVALVTLGVALGGCATTQHQSTNVEPYPTFAETLAKAQAGDAQAQADVGHDYGNGTEDVPRDKYKAMEWLGKAAAQGNGYAAEELKGLQDNLVEYNRLKAAAATGDRDAEYAYADYIRDDHFWFYDGRGFEPTSAIVWYRRAADQGQADAEAYMGLYYLRAYLYQAQPDAWDFGIAQAPASPDNFATAMTWYTRAASKGQRSAVYAMPVLYALDTPYQDLAKTEMWLQKAAYDPNATGVPAYVDLQDLWLMYRGLGFQRFLTSSWPPTVRIRSARNEKKLFVCVSHMHEQSPGGDRDEELAEMYQFGRGTPVDEAAATALYMGIFQNESRHSYDVQRAEAALGLMQYRHGDLKKAYFWLSQAAYDYTKPEPFDILESERPVWDHLFPKAKAAMKQIMARLTPEERAQQDAEAKAWQATLPEIIRARLMY